MANAINDHLTDVLHATVMGIALICATILGAIKVADGQTVLGVIAGLGGVNGLVTGIATYRNTTGNTNAVVLRVPNDQTNTTGA